MNEFKEYFTVFFKSPSLINVFFGFFFFPGFLVTIPFYLGSPERKPDVDGKYSDGRLISVIFISTIFWIVLIIVGLFSLVA